MKANKYTKVSNTDLDKMNQFIMIEAELANLDLICAERLANRLGYEPNYTEVFGMEEFVRTQRVEDDCPTYMLAIYTQISKDLIAKSQRERKLYAELKAKGLI